jgi:hypothetical protein
MSGSLMENLGFSSLMPSVLSLADRATVTTDILHLYADGTNGSDLNDGRTADTPVKTLIKVISLMPDIIKHNVGVHLKGTFTDPGYAYVKKVVLDGSWVVFSGDDYLDDGWEVVAGPFTADSSSTSTIADSGQAWTTDEYKGYAVQILSGARKDDLRQIYGNDGTEITTIQNFGGNPGNVSFQIVRPTTTIHGASGYNYFKNSCAITSGRVVFQNLFITGNVYFGAEGALGGYTQVSGVVHEGSNDVDFIYSAGRHFTFNRGIDFTTWTFVSNKFRHGLSVLGVGVRVDVNAGIAIMRDVVLSELRLQGCQAQDLNAFRIESVGVLDCWSSTYGAPISFDYSSSRRCTIGGGAGVGLLIQNCEVQVQRINISNAGTHGIEVKNGTLRIDGVLAGTGNGTSGVYAHQGSKVFTKSGSVPTITGNSGTVELSFDGSTQKADWATVDGAPQVETATDLLIAKAV